MVESWPVVAVQSHVGAVRDHNEDTAVVAGWTSGGASMPDPVVLTPRDGVLLIAVADGMGGHAAGEVASSHVATGLAAVREQLGDEPTLRAAIERLNAELFTMMAADPSRLGMGTTLAGVVIAEGRVLAFNVGDSRVYRELDGYLGQLSVDDTPAGERTAVITQALGGATNFQAIAPNVTTESQTPGRRYLLCTDGLTDELSLDAIEACLDDDDEASVRRLIAAAIAAGGQDNVTVALLRLPDPEANDQGAPA